MSESDEPAVAPWQWALGAAVLAALIAGWFLLPIQDWADAFQSWIEGLGPWGWVIFACIYIVSTVLLLPVSVLTIVAGLAFGLPIGFPLVVVSATVGATLAFLVARYLAQEKVESLVSKRPKFKAIKSAVSEGGWKVVALLRLSPVLPFNLQNYFYGITDIKLWQYVPATFVGIMPGTLLYVYLGAAGKAASGDGGGALKWTFFGIGLLATVVVAVFVTKKAKAKLKEHGVDGEGGKDKTGDKRSDQSSDGHKAGA
ncbi:MAG: TVP38/TMEM64 family protein [Rubrivivax sp.]